MTLSSLPNFTIKEIREAVPAHCFKRSLIRSFLYLFRDLAICCLFFYLATFIQTLPNFYQPFAWCVYWFGQGIVMTGVWVVAHECGHGAFSDSKTINDAVGLFFHSLLLVPYHSWRITHSKHHKGTAHMDKDQVFVPSTRTNFDGLESPLASLYQIFVMFTLGWPGYLIYNISGQKYGHWSSHFLPSSPFFDAKDRQDVNTSTVGVVVMLGLLSAWGLNRGWAEMICFYGVPYLWVNFWLVLITYLQHTDPLVPQDGEWNFVRGALATVDRDYGWLLNTMFHHIADTHVAHHLFSTMPHYNAGEATKVIKKVLGDHYYFDDSPLAVAVWRSWRACKFVEDEGEVLFYKNE